ncbi:hypothetical protein PM082_024058 [Marasmius tenuissimus]|nr:hypothetical protein PM082_024058 [Marasmius tenuissimus]
MTDNQRVLHHYAPSYFRGPSERSPLRRNGQSRTCSLGRGKRHEQDCRDPNILGARRKRVTTLKPEPVSTGVKL